MSTELGARVGEFVALDATAQLLDAVASRTTRAAISVHILRLVAVAHAPLSIGDLALAHRVGGDSLDQEAQAVLQLVEISKHLNDSISVETALPQLAEAAETIIAIVDRVELRVVPEQQLSFLVAARAAALNVDAVQRVSGRDDQHLHDSLLQHICRRVLELALYVIRVARYSAARAAFIQVF